jgi:hypothetical protein
MFVDADSQVAYTYGLRITCGRKFHSAARALNQLHIAAVLRAHTHAHADRLSRLPAGCARARILYETRQTKNTLVRTRKVPNERRVRAQRERPEHGLRSDYTHATVVANYLIRATLPRMVRQIRARKLQNEIKFA